jgi:hypothetical protein
MKALLVMVAILALNSCNTLIGVGRDTKQGFIWTRDKIQGTGGQSAYDEPVY